MAMWIRLFLALTVVGGGLLPAKAQYAMPSMPKMPSVGGLPNLGSMGAGNAAGVLDYCVKNKLLAGGSPTSVIGGLTKKPGVTSSSGFSAGKAGKILTGDGKSFALDKVQGPVKSQACNMVLKQAKTLL